MLHIALLRAVNVSGHNPVGMAALCQLLTELGFRDVRSLLQSGNLVFASDARSGDRLESQLEGAMKRRLGLATEVFVRSASEWKALVAGNPFVEEAELDPSHLLVMPLKDAPNRASVAALQAAITGRESVRVRGRQAYLVYPDGIGRSKLTNAMIEKKLGTRGTGRNWNTVLKLAALVKTA